MAKKGWTTARIEVHPTSIRAQKSAPPMVQGGPLLGGIDIHTNTNCGMILHLSDGLICPIIHGITIVVKYNTAQRGDEKQDARASVC